MLFSIVLRFGNTWFLLCLEQLDADWLNGVWCNMMKCFCKILAGGSTTSSQICIDLKYPLTQV